MFAVFGPKRGVIPTASYTSLQRKPTPFYSTYTITFSHFSDSSHIFIFFLSDVRSLFAFNLVDSPLIKLLCPYTEDNKLL